MTRSSCGLSLCAVTLFSTAPILAERNTPDGPPAPGCDEGLVANLRLEPLGHPLLGTTVEVSAALSKVAFIASNCAQASLYDIPSGVPIAWSVTAPAGATPTVTGTDTLAITVSLPAAGEYTMRFTICPGGCEFPAGGRGDLPLLEASTAITIQTVESLMFPPENEPAVPRFAKAWTDPTAFPWHDREIWCQFGGGTVDPQWVSVNEWNDVIERSRRAKPTSSSAAGRFLGSRSPRTGASPPAKSPRASAPRSVEPATSTAMASTMSSSAFPTTGSTNST